MHAHQFSDAAGRGRTSIRSGLDSADIASNTDGDKASAIWTGRELRVGDG